MSSPLLIRVYSPFFPDPNTGGSPQVIHDQLRALSEAGHQVELLIWKNSATSSLPTAKLIQCPPCSETRSKRLTRVLSSLASDRASPEDYYYPRAMRLPPLGAADLGIYHYSFAYNWLSDPSANLPAEKRRAVFFHNLESELFAQRARSAPAYQAWAHRLNAGKLQRHETLLAKKADELWFLSPVDLKTYQSKNPGVAADQCRLVGPTFSPEISKLRKNRFAQDPSESKTILGFVGGMDFGPNHESALWILEHLAPRLKNSGFQGEILFAGKGASAQLSKRAAAYPFVRFLGFVPDLEAYWLRLSYALVPHIQGSGTRIKLLESLASGVPTLASTEAGRRILPSLRDNPLLHLSDDPDQWVRWIMGQAPLRERRARMGDPFPQGLDGNEIYGFLTSP